MVIAGCLKVFEAKFGYPVDVEFALEEVPGDGLTLLILQVRPVIAS